VTDRPEVDEQIDTDGSPEQAPARQYWTALVIGVAAVGAMAVAALLVMPAARLDFFFDEVWRVEQIRSTNPIPVYLDGPAPIPPGWVFALWSVFEIVPDRRPLIRAAGALFIVPLMVFLTLTLRTMFRRSTDVSAATVTAVLAALLTVTTSAVAAHAVYFNNYLADIAVAAAILYVLTRLDLGDPHDPRSWTYIVILAAIAPWLSQSALFLVPVGCVIVGSHRACQPRRAVAAGAALCVSTAVVALAFVLPVARRGTIEDYWAPETPSAGLGQLARRFASTFVESAYPAWVGDRPALLVAGLALTVVGLVILQRRWQWWIPLYVSAQSFALLGGFLVTWPVTFVRVNGGFQVLVYAAAPAALACGVVQVARAVRTRSHSRIAAVGVAALAGVAILMMWWPDSILSNSQSETVFARGLSDDLQVVADSVGPHDLVVAYHLSGPYVRNRLVNDAAIPRVPIVDQARESVDQLDRLVGDDVQSVWCVIPYDAGPEASAAACRLDDEWIEGARTNGSRAAVVRLDRITARLGA
jgi:hypothetical protein